MSLHTASSISLGVMPEAYAPPTTAPIEHPVRQSGFIPASSIACKNPMCATPRLPPAAQGKPQFLLFRRFFCLYDFFRFFRFYNFFLFASFSAFFVLFVFAILPPPGIFLFSFSLRRFVRRSLSRFSPSEISSPLFFLIHGFIFSSGRT